MDKKAKAKNVSILSLYSGQLKRKGKLLSGRCPFHKDKIHPNFYVYPETNSWYCFAGCGGGDNISFLMKLKNISFKEAVKELANEF